MKVTNGTKLDNSVDALLANRKSILNQEAKLTAKMASQREALNATTQALLALLTGKTVKASKGKVGRPAGTGVNIAATVAKFVTGDMNINDILKAVRTAGELKNISDGSILAAVRTNKKRFDKVGRNVFRVVQVIPPTAPETKTETVS